MFPKAINIFVAVVFLFSSMMPVPAVGAIHESPLQLPQPGVMVNLSPAHMPVLIKGLKVHPENPLLFDFIIDTGNSGLKVGNGRDRSLQDESMKLIKYFLASLTIPEKDLWVNLSPYEKHRILPEALGQTELGRDMLAQDYMLKQLTASLMYPEKWLGKEFWERVYKRAYELYGTTANVPVNAFNKVWITAEKANVYVHDNTAFVVGSHLKVMLEEDYLALGKNANGGYGPQARRDRSVSPQRQGNHHNALGTQIIRQIILPEIEQEVNQGRNFANLRQIFYSMILATWYKKNLKRALLNQVYADKNKVDGIKFRRDAINGVSTPEEIYQRYLAAYKKGVFNYIREDMDKSSGQPVPRKYFSGGLMDLAMAIEVPRTNRDVINFHMQGAAVDIRAIIQDGAMAGRGPVHQEMPEQTHEGELLSLIKDGGFTFVRANGTVALLSGKGDIAGSVPIGPQMLGSMGGTVKIFDGDNGNVLNMQDVQERSKKESIVLYPLKYISGEEFIVLVVNDSARAGRLSKHPRTLILEASASWLIAFYILNRSYNIISGVRRWHKEKLGPFLEISALLMTLFVLDISGYSSRHFPPELMVFKAVHGLMPNEYVRSWAGNNSWHEFEEIARGGHQMVTDEYKVITIIEGDGHTTIAELSEFIFGNSDRHSGTVNFFHIIREEPT
ncbi:MAG: hypothetical protein HY591_03325, partial [Candidatus Omnitrophica bacterium]|nr:hypothetical protein [Candidatus Omnitrophota bacterium]